MKYTIYYTEDREERTRAQIAHLAEDTNEAKIETYLQNCWSAFIPQIPTSGEGRTKEEARENAIKNAYLSLSEYLRAGQLKVKDLTSLAFEDSDQSLSPEELLSMRPAWLHSTTQAAE